MQDIERIEVVLGPASASHGTNSFYGVINILTREAGSVRGGSVTVNLGERGISDVTATLGRAGESNDFRLSVASLQDDGDNPAIVNDGTDRKVINLRSNHRLNHADSLDLQLGFNDGKYGQGTAGRL